MKNKKVKLITLGLIAVIIVVVISVSLTQAFMKPINDTSSVTEVSLTSCAKISLTDNGSVDLNNSYPMSRNKALQTTPYSFTINSSCEGYVGFNLYIATLSTNTLDAIKVHYILTYKDSKTALAEGTLTTDKIVTNEFSEAEKTEYNAGMKGTLNNIYKIYELNLSTETSYDLYLYIDGDAGNETMNKTFKAGVAIKSFDRESTFSDYIIAQYSEQGENGLYLHDSDLENGAGDNSLRYAGGDYELTSKATSEGYNKIVSSEINETGNLIKFYCNDLKEYVGAVCYTLDPAPYYTVGVSTTQYSTYKEALEAATNQGYLTKDNIKNFVCFGSDEETCPIDNLYRIIGVFDNRVKLIKYDYATKELLGEDGDFYQREETTYYSGRKEGDPKVVDRYYWNKEGTKVVNGTSYSNVWSISKLNTINLNKNYINNINEKWSSMITETTYKVGGNDYSKIGVVNVKTAYQNEITNPNTDVEENYKARIGLMYVSDYGYATKPENWTKQLVNNSAEDYRTIKESNWMYMGYYDWTILRVSSPAYTAFRVSYAGNVSNANVAYTGNASGVRPVFYLKSSVKYASGTGTEADPYRIK